MTTRYLLDLANMRNMVKQPLIQTAIDNLQSAQFYFHKLRECMDEGNIIEFRHHTIATIAIARSIYHIIKGGAEKNPQLRKWWKKKNQELRNDHNYRYFEKKRNAILKEGTDYIDRSDFKFNVSVIKTRFDNSTEQTQLLIQRQGAKVCARVADKENHKKTFPADIRVRHFYKFSDRDDSYIASLLWNYIVTQENLINDYAREIGSTEATHDTNKRKNYIN